MPVKNRGIYTSKDCIEIWANSCSQQPSPRNYIYPIETILHKDYKKLSCTEFSDKYAWDADAYEIACKKGTKRDETVDFVVGLENGQLLMVEAKLDVENVTNLKGEVERKISHTKSILVTSLHFKSCATPSVVLFGGKNLERNIRRYRNMRNNKTDIVPMSLSDFYKRYFVD